MRIAICDDEKAQRGLVTKYLQEWARENGQILELSEFPDAESLLFCWEDEKRFDLLILDIEMGALSGMELAERIRRENEDIPILFISARTSDDDKIVALNIGGDDYIQKPCSLSVLLAKVRVVLRRYGHRPDQNQEGYSDGRLRVDFDAREVRVMGKPVRLTGG